MTDSNPWFRGTWDPGHDISSEQTEFATALRVPFLTSPYPSRNYISGIVVDDHTWHGSVPTDEEVEVVAGVLVSYLDYFFPKPNRFREAMQEYADYDVDSGAVAFYFIKKRDGSWGYRRSSWRDTFAFRPDFREKQLTLEELIDQASLRWVRR